FQDDDLFFPRPKEEPSAAAATREGDSAGPATMEPPPFHEEEPVTTEPLPFHEEEGAPLTFTEQEPEELAFSEGYEEAQGLDEEEPLAEAPPGYEDEFDEPRPRRRQRDDRRGGRRGDRRGFGRSGGFGRPGFGRPKPLIQDIFKRGQEVL